MCDRNCNQGRLCPARLYPGIGKCSDLNHWAPGPIQGGPRDEERKRTIPLPLKVAIVLAYILFAVIVLMAALGYSCFRWLFKFAERRKS
jgi:hypothetical protein